MSDDLKVDWGAEIPMHGNRPDWLSDEDHIAVKNDDWRGSVIVGNLTTGSWKHLTAIRLPADHQCYRYAPRNPEAPSDDIAKRMEALVRAIADGFYMRGVNDEGITINQAVVEADAIVALLPEPVDADREEAKQIAESMEYCWSARDRMTANIDAAILAAIRRGRALERDSREG